jgi:hypothetical protein
MDMINIGFVFAPALDQRLQGRVQSELGGQAEGQRGWSIPGVLPAIGRDLRPQSFAQGLAFLRIKIGEYMRRKGSCNIASDQGLNVSACAEWSR